MNIKKLIKLYTLSEKRLYNYILKQYPEAITKKNGYIFINNNSSIMLVCHLDKVNKVPKKQDIIIDKTKIYALNTSLGADDRSGVYIALEMLKLYKVSVLFTCKEETGGIGVKKFIKDNILSNNDKSNIEFFIELDRRGVNEYVRYDTVSYFSYGLKGVNYNFDFGYEIKQANTPDIIETIAEEYGIEENCGSYSDVADLTDAYKIPHMNLSVGYYNEHSINEFQSIFGLEFTINLLKTILKNEMYHYK